MENTNSMIFSTENSLVHVQHDSPKVWRPEGEYPHYGLCHLFTAKKYIYIQIARWNETLLLCHSLAVSLGYFRAFLMSVGSKSLKKILGLDKLFALRCHPTRRNSQSTVLNPDITSVNSSKSIHYFRIPHYHNSISSQHSLLHGLIPVDLSALKKHALNKAL